MSKYVPVAAVDVAMDAWGVSGNKHQRELLESLLEAAAPIIKEQAFDYGWREGKHWPTPVNTDTGELLHDEAERAPWNPYRDTDERGQE